MSDFRLETVDCEERKNTAFLACPCLPAGSSNDEAKVEEISIGLHMLSNDSQDLQPDLLPSAPFPEEQVRAAYRLGSQCPRVVIQSRVLGCGIEEGSLRSSRRAQTGASNETKNIAKNYGKAIIAFMQRNKRLFRAICRSTSTPYQRITEELTELKGSLTTVMGFREVWTNYKYAECMRMVSEVFLRKSALSYIFNSKIANVQTHLKYRLRFLKALRNPAAFDHIKDY